MEILKKILRAKKQEVKEKKELYPIKLLEKSLYYESKGVSFSEYLLRDDLLGVIAEIKRASPSKGSINSFIDIEKLSIGYMQGGASALSVLTDGEFFGGSSEDLKIARASNFCPILRKDFIIDEYQVIEAKSIGADAILLIAAALDKKAMQLLGSLAHTLGMEVLVEVHSEEELRHVPFEVVHCIGVNNRDLNTFNVSVETSMTLFEKLPKEVVKISESGIDSAKSLVRLKNHGYNGFLIGEQFMKQGNPALACQKFIREAGELLRR